MSVVFRVAETDEDRAAIYRLRYELYVEQQGLFGDTADHERRFLCDEDDPRSILIMAESEGRLIGTIRLTGAPFSYELRKTYEMDRFAPVIPDERIFVGMRLLVLPELRGGMLAMQCLLKAAEVAAMHKADLIVGNCEAHLLNHYQKMGFRPYGQLYNHPQNGVLVSIALVIGDLDHFRKLRSPLLGPFEKANLQIPAEKVAKIRDVLSDEAAVRSKVEMSTGIFMGTIAQLLDDEDGLCGVIPDLTPEEARTLLDMSHLMECKPGDAIILKGHVSRTLYLLLSGSLEVRRDNRIVVELDEGGQVVGEVAFFTQGGRMSDVIAGSKGARVLALSDRTLRELVKSHGPVAAKFLYYVAQGLCHKLRTEAAVKG